MCAYLIDNWFICQLVQPRQPSRGRARGIFLCLSISVESSHELCAKRKISFIYFIDPKVFWASLCCDAPKTTLYSSYCTKPCPHVQLERSQCIRYLLLTIVKSDRNTFCLVHVVVVIVMCCCCCCCTLPTGVSFVICLTLCCVSAKWHC